jgi:thymidylate synthase
MNYLDKQYQDLLQSILDNGVTKSDRTGTGTISIFGRQIRHKMSDGFPLLTTKKMPFKTMVTELLWFLKGDTNIKYLVDNNCHIWDGDAYKNYLHKVIRDKDIVHYLKSYSVDANGVPTIEPYSQEEFINKIKTDDKFAKKWGSLGPVYGKQWRSWGRKNVTNYDLENVKSSDKVKVMDLIHDGGDYSKYDVKVTYQNNSIDQIANLINDLKTNPDSRRLMVNAWNVGELDSMVLPPCHYGFQVYTRELSFDERCKIQINRLDGMYSSEKDLFIHSSIDEVKKAKMDKNKIPTRAISLMWNQRSVDTFLGLPFNIASYGLLLEIIAKIVNMVPDELIGNLGDTHLYLNHIEQAKEQIGRELSLEERIELASKDPVFDPGDFGVGEQVTDEHCHEICDSYSIPRKTREPFKLPTLVMVTNPDLKFDEYVYNNFKLVNYQSHLTIKAPLSN